jgi:hypothetical protein
MQVALFLLFIVAQLNAADEQTGTVCVASRANTPFRGQVIPQHGEVGSGGLRVKIDKRPSIAWPQRQGLTLDNLDVNVTHSISVVNAKGQFVESVRFRFSEYNSRTLCMAYDGYQGIGLQELTKHTPWCKCK